MEPFTVNTKAGVLQELSQTPQNPANTAVPGRPNKTRDTSRRNNA
jgi:hypothetical protein